MRQKMTTLHKKQTGQGALLIMIALISAGVLSFAVADMMAQSHQNAQQYTITDKNSLSAYYYAQSGLQEALGTRFTPASNCLNFEKTAGVYNPYRSQSGRFSADGSLITTADVMPAIHGLYRYIVKLKTNPASIDYTNPNTSVDFDIYSEGAVCVDTRSQKIDTGAISYINGIPTCSGSNNKLVQMPIQTEVTLKQLSNNSFTTITAANQNKFNSSVRISPQNFQSIWNQECGTSSSGPTPIKYMIGKSAPQSWSNNITNADIKKTLTIIFDKAIDYRTLKNVRIFQSGTSTTNLNNSENLLVSINYQFVETGNSLTIYPPVASTTFSSNTYDLYLTDLTGYDGRPYANGSQKITFRYN
jgi:hypothetical protein